MSGAQHAPAQQLLLEEPLELLQGCALHTELPFLRLQLSGSPPLHHSSSTRGRAVGLGLPWANPRCPASGKLSLIHVDFDTATIRVLLSMTGVSRALSISQGTDGDDSLTIAPFNLFNLHPFKLRFNVADSPWMETGVPLPPSIPSAQAR